MKNTKLQANTNTIPSDGNSSIYQDLLDKKTKLALIGLGYVGLPIALEFAKKIDVIGFDISEERIKMMQNGADPSKELPASSFEDKDIVFTHETDLLQEARFFVVAVPTPVTDQKYPDLRPLKSASRTVGKALKKGDYVVYESTVYPGCTEEDCVPILEQLSGLKAGRDFKVGYSPERINPGDTEHTLTKVIKVAAGCDPESSEIIAKVYELVVEAGVYRAASIKVAEAAKVIENTQRDLNIALMNELSVIFDRMGISTFDVLEAAGTKWNFLKFYPGLVGGHCIGVDPYYLTYKSTELGYKPEVILSGRRINDNLSTHIAQKVVKLLIHNDKNISQSKILIKGITFKENVSDIRNSKVVDLVKELQSYKLQVDIVDPHASSEELNHEYDLQLLPKSEMSNDYAAIIVAVKHDEYTQLDEAYFESITCPKALLIDIKGIYRKSKIEALHYWTL